MFKHTPVQAREAWVQALRSDQYEQGRGGMRDGDRFCCLGVACDLFLKLEGRGEWDQDNNFVAAPGDRSFGELPDLVCDWLELSSNRGCLTDNISYDDDEETCLASDLTVLNDNAGYSFAAIADVIEAGKVRQP